MKRWTTGREKREISKYQEIMNLIEPRGLAF